MVAGDSVSFTITTQLGPAAVDPIVNTASVHRIGHLDPLPSNDTATDTDHLLSLGPCGFYVERFLEDQVIDTETEIAACDRVTLGPNLQIVAPGLLAARAGLEILFAENVSSAAGTELILIIDPSLQP